MAIDTNPCLQTHKIIHSSVLEKYIGEKIIPVVLRIEKLGEYTAFLHAETDDEGNRKIMGIIYLQEKRYECMLCPDASPHGSLHILPLDDGSYNNMNPSDRRESDESN